MSLIYEDKTEVLRKCFFAVQNEVGLGRQEEEYHQACKVWLAENRIYFASKAPHPLCLDGKIAHTLYPDLVAWDAITIELKAVPRKLRSSEYVQLFDYLKCRSDRLGLLVNMGLDRVYVERVVYSEAEALLEEDWEHWSERICGQDREVGLAVRDQLRSIYEAHGTGYGKEVLTELILFSLRNQGLSVLVSPIAKAYFRGVELSESPLNCLVVENRIVLAFTALFDSNDFNISRGYSYLKTLGLSWGVAVNFGKSHVALKSLSRSA